ncbi:MAG: hypothetical protein ACFHXK_14665 [bacterium]
MSLELRRSAWRVYLGLVWVGYMAWVAFFWLGFAGVSLVCVLSTRFLRRLLAQTTHSRRVLELSAGNIRGFWQLGSWLCIRNDAGSHWILHDEILPGQRAALCRYLLEHVPRQAVGLRISS